MIPFEVLIDKIREVCDRYPLRVSQLWCFNEDGTPEDPIGHALHELGVTLPEHYNERLSIAFNWPLLGFTRPTDEQRDWVDNLQVGVDGNYPWVLALVLADMPDVELAK